MPATLFPSPVGAAPAECSVDLEELFPDLGARAATFSICDASSACWYLDKLAALAEKKSRYTAQYQEIMQAIDADEKRLKDRFEPELNQWALEQLAAQGKGKTVKLLAGSISFTHVGQKITIADPKAAFAAALEMRGSTIKVVESLDTAGYREVAKERLERDGELLPGCEIVPAYESMRIKLGGQS